MSYEPTVWKKGDIVTSEKLNKIENGIANCGNIMVVNVVPGEPDKLDKTWQEIYDATEMKMIVVLFYSAPADIHIQQLSGIYIDESSYTIIFTNSAYSTLSPTAYPQRVEQVIK